MIRSRLPLIVPISLVRSSMLLLVLSIFCSIAAIFVSKSWRYGSNCVSNDADMTEESACCAVNEFLMRVIKPESEPLLKMDNVKIVSSAK